jgi:AcrR family transcriptional regulator
MSPCVIVDSAIKLPWEISPSQQAGIIDTVTSPTTSAPRDLARTRLVEVASDLLSTGGTDAVTTRSVAVAAGVQAPMIYRLFGDKDGLLAAVAEHGFESYMARKHPVDADDDPVVGLRRGWDLHIGFGLANPALFRLMHTALRTANGQAVADAGGDVLRARVRRVAQAGRLRVSEGSAVELIRSAGTGAVFTLIDRPEVERDDSLADLLWDSVCAVMLTDAAATDTSSTTAAAVTLRAALPDLGGFSAAEASLFGEWLDRAARRR